MIRLHLGCGENYIPGYINIDFPPRYHTVQRNQKIDLYADIKQLAFKKGTVNEIRSHHVFEHFDRITSLKMLIEWYQWLDADGILIIETPDFKKCLQYFKFGGKFPDQIKALRHIFGSQEAMWANHLDGWYKEKFEIYLKTLGYTDLSFKYKKWHGTHNITVIAKKTKPFKTINELKEGSERLLRYSLVDDSDTENRLLNIWLDELKKS